ncbi:hypothetical protein, partial [Lentibacillus halophilus]
MHNNQYGMPDNWGSDHQYMDPYANTNPHHQYMDPYTNANPHHMGSHHQQMDPYANVNPQHMSGHTHADHQYMDSCNPQYMGSHHQYMDPQYMNQMSHNQQMYDMSKKCHLYFVQLQTMDGMMCDGIIEDFDENCVILLMPYGDMEREDDMERQYGFGYGGFGGYDGFGGYGGYG